MASDVGSSFTIRFLHPKERGEVNLAVTSLGFLDPYSILCDVLTPAIPIRREGSLRTQSHPRYPHAERLGAFGVPGIPWGPE